MAAVCESDYAAVLGSLQKLRRRQDGSGWVACCPAHEDRAPSLTLKISPRTGRLLCKCWAGCPWEDVVAATGTQASDWFPLEERRVNGRARPRPDGARRQAEYDYFDEHGELLFQTVRVEWWRDGSRTKKSFFQRRPDGKGGWVNDLAGVRLVPYRLPDIVASPEAVVCVAEGERCVEVLAKFGWLATTNAGGASKWGSECSRWLRGRRVLVFPDNDEVGERHAVQVVGSLVMAGAAALKVVRLPLLPRGGDVADFVALGGTARDIAEVVRAVPAWRPH